MPREKMEHGDTPATYSSRVGVYIGSIVSEGYPSLTSVNKFVSYYEDNQLFYGISHSLEAKTLSEFINIVLTTECLPNIDIERLPKGEELSNMVANIKLDIIQYVIELKSVLEPLPDLTPIEIESISNFGIF